MRIADRKSDIVPEVKMKKPEVYRKMYTGAEMYRNERQERLSQQMDKLNSDFIKMLYAGGKWDTMENTLNYVKVASHMRKPFEPQCAANRE